MAVRRQRTMVPKLVRMVLCKSATLAPPMTGRKSTTAAATQISSVPCADQISVGVPPDENMSTIRPRYHSNATSLKAFSIEKKAVTAKTLRNGARIRAGMATACARRIGRRIGLIGVDEVFEETKHDEARRF